MARKPGSRADVTGPRLRAAAQSLFARHGYAAVSMRQIAAEVGVQAGALYQYTPDKQTLLFDLMRDHMTGLLEAWAQSAPPLGPALVRLDHFVRFHIRFHTARPEAVFIAYMELRNLEPANFVHIEKLRRAYEGEVERILAAGQAEGSLEVADLRLGAMALIAMLNGVPTWFREGGRLSLEMIEELHAQMARRALGAPDLGAPGLEAAVQ